MTNLTKSKEELLKLLEQKEQEIRYNKINIYFPDEGPFKRELYPKHVDFMNKGSQYRERAFVAANRVGKSLVGGFEMACHLTGIYPKWWQGKKFLNAVDAWACGVTNQSVKEVAQEILLGKINDMGSGLIPKQLIVGTPTKKANVPNAVETVFVQHSSGGISQLTFKAYEQGREVFQGVKRQVIWFDEEPKQQEIYSECLIRLMDKYNPGIIYSTFTPLFGLSDVVLSFMPGGQMPRGGVDPENAHKFIMCATWDDVPHLSKEEKEEILRSCLPHERAARSKGIPSLGAGAIYPYVEEDITVEPFSIPDYWPRVYGLDIGWNKTAAIWLAVDPNSNNIYAYSEYYAGQAAPAIHASTIRAHGEWIPGAIDPASKNVGSLADGKAMLDLYANEGLFLEPADNAVEAGLLKVGQLFESGRLKIFTSLSNFFSEYRVYRRDENGKIVKKRDHLLDALRYAIVTGLDMVAEMPDPDAARDSRTANSGKNEFTGY